MDRNTRSIQANLAKSTQEGKYLAFEIDLEQYGIGIENVIDIIGVQDITEIPGQPAYIQGVINLRGQIIPTMDVRLRFEKEQIPYDNRTCIVVIDHKGMSVGIIVDKVLEVKDIEGTHISQPPEATGLMSNQFIAGITKKDDEVLMLLDAVRLLMDEQPDEYRHTES